jgi:hypothetical protein
MMPVSHGCPRLVPSFSADFPETRFRIVFRDGQQIRPRLSPDISAGDMKRAVISLYHDRFLGVEAGSITLCTNHSRIDDASLICDLRRKVYFVLADDQIGCKVVICASSIWRCNMLSGSRAGLDCCAWEAIAPDGHAGTSHVALVAKLLSLRLRQACFLRGLAQRPSYLWMHSCRRTIKNRIHAVVFDITPGTVAKILNKRKKTKLPVGCHVALTSEEKHMIVDFIQKMATLRDSPKRKDILLSGESKGQKMITEGLLTTFTNRRARAVICRSIAPPEPPCLQMPQECLSRFIRILGIHVNGINPKLVFTLDETEKSD